MLSLIVYRAHAYEDDGAGVGLQKATISRNSATSSVDAVPSGCGSRRPLLLNPGLELTQTELARRVGASLTSVIDEVRRLTRAGILTSRSLGNARLVRAGEGPLVDALAEVVLRAFGPVQIVGEEFDRARAQLGGVIEHVEAVATFTQTPPDLDGCVALTASRIQAPGSLQPRRWLGSVVMPAHSAEV